MESKIEVKPGAWNLDLLLAAFSPMKKKTSGQTSRITHHAARNSLRPFSSILFDGDERAAARAMLYPVGFKPHFNMTATSR